MGSVRDRCGFSVLVGRLAPPGALPMVAELWVKMHWARQIAVVDLQQRKVIRRIDVGRSPHGIYFHDRAPLL